MELRQWAQNSEILTNHVKDQTDSFTLLIKSMMILSKVKVFNNRYRTRYRAAGDSDFVHDLLELDAREVDEFKALDDLIEKFTKSFPKSFKNPINGSTVDPQLLNACVAPHV